ncbi:probable serine/threonine-protein kinase dyrk1 [Ceratitis capitata]|nr:probable serine/threonine-protein kinase dyrk1 [Ceratitis capitata]XP_012162881.1 probable serine/threonine-protein kinase dyrk1 [Ceratitis capitata]
MALQHYLKHTDNYCGTAPTDTTAAAATPATSKAVITQTHLQLQQHAATPVTTHSYQQQQQQQLVHFQQQQQQQQQQAHLQNITTEATAETAAQGLTALAASTACRQTIQQQTQQQQQLIVQSQHRLKQLQLKQPTIHQQHMTYHHHHPYYQQSNSHNHNHNHSHSHHNNNSSTVANTLANTGAANHKFKSAQHNQQNYNPNRTLPIHALNQNSNFSAASSSTGGGTASSHAPTQQSNATNSSRSSAANARSNGSADNAKAGGVGSQMRSGTTAANSAAVNAKKLKIEPVLSQYLQTERLNFANAHIAWGEEHWRRVVFQDERKFNLDGPDGFSSYFHDLRNYEQMLSQRPRGNSVYIYMLITAGGPIHMEVSTAKQRPQTYIETILRERPNIIAKLGGNPDFILQDHNWTANMTATTQETLDAEGFKMQHWPSIAHDLNIMENIWGWLIREVYDGGRKFSRKDDLIFRVRAAWTRLPMDFVVNLYSTLPERIAELYYTRGIYTNC